MNGPFPVREKSYTPDKPDKEGCVKVSSLLLLLSPKTQNNNKKTSKQEKKKRKKPLSLSLTHHPILPLHLDHLPEVLEGGRLVVDQEGTEALREAAGLGRDHERVGGSHGRWTRVEPDPDAAHGFGFVFRLVFFFFSFPFWGG